MDKAFLLSYQDTRADNPIEYKLVYAADEKEAKDKLKKSIAKQKYGDYGASREALNVQSETIL